MVKKSSLGKGLDALITEEIEEVIDLERHKLVHVDINHIQPNALQPRKSFDENAIDALSESIKRNGILQPLILRPISSGYEIIAGERRFRSAKLAGLHKVPAVVMDPDEQKLYEIALIENMQRVDLNPIEEALAFQSLINSFNMTQSEVSNVVGKSRTYITNALRLLSLDDVVMNTVSSGKLSAGHAKVLVGLLPELQRQMTNTVMRDELSVRDLEKRVKLLKNPPSTPKRDRNEDYKYYEPYIKQLEDTLGTKVDVNLSGSQSKITVSFYSDKDFERLFELITRHS